MKSYIGIDYHGPDARSGVVLTGDTDDAPFVRMLDSNASIHSVLVGDIRSYRHGVRRKALIALLRSHKALIGRLRSATPAGARAEEDVWKS